MNLKKYTDKFGIIVKNIVEVGARDCLETLMLKETFPGSKIVTFECNPEMIPVCEKNIEGKEDIVLIKKAVSNTNGKDYFYILNTGDKGSSSLFIHKDIPGSKVEVEVTTLDSELKVSPDLLWLDTQGSELNIFKGATNFLKDISLIYSEVYFTPAYKDQPSYKDIKKYLNANGFFVVGFSDSWGNFSDAIFVNKKFKPAIPQFFVEINHFFIKSTLFKINRLLSLLKK